MTPATPLSLIAKFFSVFKYSRVAIQIVWGTSAGLTILMAVATLLAGVLPAAIAYVGQLIVDAVVAAIQSSPGEREAATDLTIFYVLCEAGLVIFITGVQRINTVCQSILRVLLGNKINVMILEKSLTLELAHFEDSEYYDKLVRARREASSRPLSLVIRTFDLLRESISLVSYGFLLFQFSPWAVLLLACAGLPAFLAEAKFSGEAFRNQRHRSAERRMQIYLEMVLTREDGVKEVKLLKMGKLFLQRYIDIFRNIYKEDRNLVLRRGFWGYVLGLIASAAFYFAYGWVVFAAIATTITIGQMTMYIAVFRQGQNAVTSSLTAVNGMYEDNLYLSNLVEYLEHKVPEVSGDKTEGPDRADGIRFENVSFYYPESKTPAIHDLNLHIKAGESLAIVGENGSGKTTLIKLLTRLYTPTSGRILLEGLDLQEWDIEALRNKIGVIFQDFSRYQLTVSDNIGIGDVDNMEVRPQVEAAARDGLAADFIQYMPQNYDTQLGTWFKGGKELSGGQWQKIALSRAFMRNHADVLILDEPTSAIDAKAEADIFAHFRELTENRISIIISHRFSTVRIADHIIVLDKGVILEEGSHEDLLARNGQYAHLFNLQAKGYM
ncbi:MAG: ABC transporter ATP-binding protein [Gammaproteobacteria bacterium]|nr:ABC transporter ATP-binding protein [Gammaproteobacteria bacterium]MDP2141584.1 ABC transporter ATP-binding protein [Gammaproteobacteria bacterium]MDP2346661.1 ABC transporter ATP-binding protein [Gammaproteobacteria bacterium]